MAQKTISQLIDDLTWFDLVNKLKKILKGFVGNISGTYIEGGDNVTITGNGEEGTPYIISADGGGGIEEAPLDGGPYGRQAANWVEISNDTPTLQEVTDEGATTDNEIIVQNGPNYSYYGTSYIDSRYYGISSDGYEIKDSFEDVIISYQKNKIVKSSTVLPSVDGIGTFLFPNTGAGIDPSIEETLATEEWVRGTSYTVGTLPAGTLGSRAIVTDATAPTFLGALTGGGAVVCPVWYNGSNWVSA